MSMKLYSEPYLFISYATGDRTSVLPILNALFQKGARFWFDNGVQDGKARDEDAVRAMQSCHASLVFVSDTYDHSEACQSELAALEAAEKPVMRVYLDRHPKTVGSNLQLDVAQAVYASMYKDRDGMISDLLRLRKIQTCRNAGDFLIDEFTSTLVKYSGRATSVTIPQEVTRIGNGAFAGCGKLESVVCHNGITEIGDHAFLNCVNLVSVTLPDTLESLGAGAFKNCVKLSGIVIPEGVAEIGACTFYECNVLRSAVLPSTLKRIGFWAFSGAGLRSLFLPEGCEFIDDSAFSLCHALENVSLPRSMETVYFNAFDQCKKLQAIYAFKDSPCRYDLEEILSDDPEAFALHLL